MKDDQSMYVGGLHEVDGRKSCNGVWRNACMQENMCIPRNTCILNPTTPILTEPPHKLASSNYLWMHVQSRETCF
jgi:hypothetical protein